ncbi:hypothetical protein Ancab_035611, partial [Ancistrocladus abbreviatus]
MKSLLSSCWSQKAESFLSQRQLYSEFSVRLRPRYGAGYVHGSCAGDRKIVVGDLWFIGGPNHRRRQSS